MSKPIKIINVKILSNGEIEMDNLSLGMQYEKNATKLVFEIPEELKEYNKTIEFSTGDDKNFTDIILNNEYLIDNNVSCCLFVSFQVTFTDIDGNEVFKTIVKDQIFDKSINAVDPAPTPEEVSQWNTMLTEFNTKIKEVDEIKEISDYAKEQGDYAKETADNIGEVSEYVIKTADEAKEKSEEAISISKGANPSLSFGDYATMVSVFNSLDNQTYKVGQNVLIVTLNVPDLWISEIAEESAIYTYTTDEAITTLLQEQGYIQIGYYKLSALETQKVDLKGYVKDTDYATYSKAGLVRPTNGLTLVGANKDAIGIAKATDTQIDTKTDNYAPIVPSNLDYAVKSGMANNSLEWTDEEKASARNLINTIGRVEYNSTDGSLRGRVYVVDHTGTQTTKELRTTGTTDSIPLRNARGNFYVGTPSIGLECTNKNYVDNLHQTLTQAEYDALTTKDANTYYYIVEE